jgi:hypothetical protein
MLLLERELILTPADHATHHRLGFEVPPDCLELRFDLAYAPKWLPAPASHELATAALERQAARLSSELDRTPLVDVWREWWLERLRDQPEFRISNLVTITLDDAAGTFRGANHRHAAEQHLVLRTDAASPGLTAGPLPVGTWTLTLSAHTLVSPSCVYAIQIGAETASSPPSTPRTSA